MRAVPLALAACTALACSEPIESRLLPSPLHRVSLGMSPGLLARERPAVEAAKCGEAVDPDPRCVRERRPVAGVAGVEYRFSGDRLVELRADLEPSPFVPGAVETRLAGLRGIRALGDPEVRLESRPFVRTLALRWAEDDRRVTVAFALEDPSGLGDRAPPGRTLLRPSLSIRTGSDPPRGEATSLRQALGALAVFSERAKLRADLLAGAWAAEAEPGYCRRFAALVRAESLCTAAWGAIERGRLRPEEREAIDRALGSLGYRPFAGTIVARVADGLYEVQPVPAHGPGLLPAAGPPVVIRTPEAKFGQRVRVALQLKPTADDRFAALVEDPIAAAARRLAAAPPGDGVRTSARELLARVVRETGP